MPSDASLCQQLSIAVVPFSRLLLLKTISSNISTKKVTTLFSASYSAAYSHNVPSHLNLLFIHFSWLLPLLLMLPSFYAGAVQQNDREEERNKGIKKREKILFLQSFLPTFSVTRFLTVDTRWDISKLTVDVVFTKRYR